MRRRKSARGFTLLEVMVAIAILGLGLTAILSAQAGAFASAAHARNLSVATGLSRCKMLELEEDLLRNGFQELDVTAEGPCCDNAEGGIMRCSWRVEKPVMPTPQYGQLDLASSFDPSSLGAVGALLQPGAAKEVFSDSSKLGDIASQLAGANAAIPGAEGAEGAEGADPAGAAPTGVGMIASMAMGFVYPNLKTLFEASTRRVTVDLKWNEGIKEHTLTIEQWVVQPQKGLADAEAADEAEEAASSLEEGPSGPAEKEGDGKRKGPPGRRGPPARPPRTPGGK